MLTKRALICSSIIALLFAIPLVASTIESSNQNLFILLNTISNANESYNGDSCWNSDLKNYIETNIAVGEGFVYCAEYNSTINSPVDFAKN